MHRNEFEAKIVARAWKDESFRAELQKDPKGVLQRELSALKGGEVKLPDNFKVQVLQETAEEMFLVIPMNPLDTHSSLTDEQLLAVAGGTGPTVAVVGPAQAQTLDVVAVVNDPTMIVGGPIGGPIGVVVGVY